MLVELAGMSQPWVDCWPECDDAFAGTLAERRRIRMGLSPRLHVRPVNPEPPPIDEEKLPVSEPAAAILDKLLRKSYGLKPVRVFTLVQKWVHQANEDHVEELMERGNLEWTDASLKTTVNLVADRLADTERIVEIFRRVQRM